MGKGGGGTNTTNTVTNSSPPPQVLAQYENLIGQSNQVAQTPYTTGGFNASNMLAGFTPDQTSAFNTVDQSQGIQNPYLAAGQADLNASQTPLWNGVQQYSPSTMAQYANPYLNQAVGSTEAQIQNTNAQQQNQVMGNAISSGAWGGDRSAIAQSELANQQDLAENQTISNMENTGFNQQQGEFNTEQSSQLGANEANAWLGSQGAALESGLGTTAQTTALNGATAQYNMGTAQQQQNQSALNIPYEQFQAEQAYPFQTLQYNADISEGLGSSSGGTGTGSTTSPAPNEFSQDVGTAAGLGTLGYLGYLGYGALGLSDKRLKENIKKIGTMKGNNGFYPIYTYNFKGDNETRMGVIAQDVEKRNPDAVKEINGYKAVHYDKLARGGFIPHRASGGFTPQHFDLGGGTGGATPGYLPPSSFGDTVPSVGTVNINPQSMPHGAGPPNVKAPMPYAPPANNGLQGGIGNMASILKAGGLNGSNGSTGNNVLPSTASEMDSTGSLDEMSPDAIDDLSLARGGVTKGFTPRHYDGGGGIGLPTAQQTGASPGVANVANQLQNMTVEQLQQLNARSGGRNPQIQMALQRKQMTGGAAQQPQQAGMAPMAAQAQGAAPPAQAAAVPSGAQPENIMQQQGYARGGFTPQHFDTGGGDDTPIPDPNGDIASGLGGSPQLQGMNPMQYAALANINRSAPPIASPASSTQGITPQNSSGTPPLPSHDDFMKNYNSEVMNAAPYNKPDPILSLLSAMGAIGAGRSSKFGVNAGQGAEEGIQNWANQNKEAAAESERRGTLQEQGESMYQKMVDARNDMNLRNEQLQQQKEQMLQTGKYQQGELANAAADTRIKQQIADQGKIASDTFGQRYYTAGPKAGQNVAPEAATGAPGAAGAITPDIANVWKPPVDKDGKPLTGDDYYATVPPMVAKEGKLMQDGQKASPSQFGSRDPVLRAGEAAASNADPTYTGTRYSTIQDFEKSSTPAAATARSQNAIAEHLPVLQGAITALDNGDERPLNALANQIAKQNGEPAPTNTEMAMTIVSDEGAKAIIGSKATQGDREEFSKNLTTSAGRQQLQGQLTTAGKLIAGQMHAGEQAYNTGTGLDPARTPADTYAKLNYRDKFMSESPNARKLMETYYPTPLPPVEKRVVGKTYWGPGAKQMVWSQDDKGNKGWAAPQGAQ